VGFEADSHARRLRCGGPGARRGREESTFPQKYLCRMDLVVRSIEPVTSRVASFELADPAGAPLPPFTAGSHVDVELPNGLVRSYSLLNDSRERHRYVLAVLREDASSGGSAWMHEGLRVGDTLAVAGPQNRFELDEGGDHNILIAGGIGITPILSMAERLDELGIDFRLYYCTRSRAEAAFAERLEERFGDRVVLHHTGGVRELRLDVAALLRVREPGTHVYVCGPADLIATVRSAAKEWPQGTVHFELFGAVRADVGAAAENRPFDVHLRRRDVTLHVPADRSILDVLAANGVRVRTVCRDGFCGTCTTRYLAGNVEHRDGVLDEEGRRSLIQVCVSRALPGDMLVLDL
jgi:ferredoxin-NADP reductase